MKLVKFTINILNKYFYVKKQVPRLHLGLKVMPYLVKTLLYNHNFIKPDLFQTFIDFPLFLHLYFQKWYLVVFKLWVEFRLLQFLF